MLYGNWTGFTYGEHFAVSPKWRNGGVGARILKEVMETVPGMFCLEVELPKDELSKRRIRFYERNGFFLNPYPYVQPPLSDGQEELPLQIMTAGNPISLENSAGSGTRCMNGCIIAVWERTDAS